jgi:hypothetical protein
LSGNVRPRDLGVHRADRLQQAQVRPDDALLLGDGVEPPGPRVTVAVDVVTQTWDQPGTVPFGLHGLPRQAVPPGVVGRLACAQRRAQEPGGVLCHAQEAGTRTEHACRQRALHRLGRRQVRESGGDRGRREPVVGQPGEHRLEQPGLAGCGSPSCRQPERELAEPDGAHDVVGQVLAEQADAVGRRDPERRGEGFGVAGRGNGWPCRCRPVPLPMNVDRDELHRLVDVLPEQEIPAVRRSPPPRPQALVPSVRTTVTARSRRAGGSGRR